MSSASGGSSSLRGRGRGRGIGKIISSATVVGRGEAKFPAGRARGGRGLVHPPSPPQQPGTPRLRPPSVPVPSDNEAAIVASPVSPVVRECEGEPLRVKVLLSSLGDDTDVDDIKAHFNNLCGHSCEGDIEIVSAVLLGSRKAELELNGVTIADQKELSAGCHVIKGSRVKVEFQQLRVAQEGQMEGDSDGEDDEGPMKLEVADVPATISLESLKCFFELERSGGGSGAVADICSVGTGVFHVTFHDRKVAARVMSEPRRVKKKAVLKMRPIEESECETQERNSVDPTQIEVHNIPDGVTDYLVKVYFETLKSGSCPKAVAECRKSGNGVFVVSFHDPKVAAQVMSQSGHVIEGASVGLQYVCHSRTEFKMNQLVIRGIPRVMEKNAYKIVLADCDCLDMSDFELVFNGDTSAIITFPKNYTTQELQKMKQKIEDKEVEGVRVTVEMIKHTKPSIRVNNIVKYDEEYLREYFESTRLSGGGEIERVTRLDESTAIITFVEPAVIKSVLNHRMHVQV